MKKFVLFSILLGSVMLVGCPKPSTKAIPPVGTLPPVSAPISASPGGGAPATTKPGEVPTVKDGAKPIAEKPAVETKGID